jgi:hypothetical protein
MKNFCIRRILRQLIDDLRPGACDQRLKMIHSGICAQDARKSVAKKLDRSKCEEEFREGKHCFLLDRMTLS